MTITTKHQLLIVGGGTAGITVAARMLRKGFTDVAVIEPSSTHYYQPLWTLVGGGQAKASSTERAEASVMPTGATWIENAASAFDPDGNTVTCADGATYEYDVLVVCPGIQLDWNRTEGLEDALGRDGVSSNYRFDLAPRTWDFIRTLRSGTAVFTVPSGAIKCAGAAQKIAYLASDSWRAQGVLKDIDVHLVMPGARPFGIPAIADSLDEVIADYGITLHTNSEVTTVDAASHKVGVTSVGAGGSDLMLPYDVLHAVPRQSAPDWIKSSPLSTGDANGYVDIDIDIDIDIDKHTMQHVRYPNVFSLGDAGSSPNSKTGAAIRKQAPVVVDNVGSFLHNRPLQASYDGTRRARSSPRRTQCCSPSSTTTCSWNPASRCSIRRPRTGRTGTSRSTGCRSCTGISCSKALPSNSFATPRKETAMTIRNLSAAASSPPSRRTRSCWSTSGRRGAAVHVKVDTEAQHELAAALQIQSIPTVMAFRDGILVYRQPGAMPAAALEDLIAQVKELDMTEVRANIAAATS